MLGYLILTVVVISLLRTVIGIVAKLFSSAASGPDSQARTARRKSEVPAGGVLKKDPVCGIYVSEHTPVKLIAAGETHFFCSEDCLNKFRARKS